MPGKRKPSQTDEALRAALEKAYAARSRLFRSEVAKRRLGALSSEVRHLDASGLAWDAPELGISEPARTKILAASIPLHCVFCHPDLLAEHRHIVDYYRLMAAISAKGLGQIVSGHVGRDRLCAQSRALNRLITAFIEKTPGFSLEAMRDIMMAEVGSEIQGTWVNLIGKGAADRVRELLEEYARGQGLLERTDTQEAQQGGKTVRLHAAILKKGWRMVFGSEPDVAILDPEGVLQSAIEIKGSMDKAGAPTRYGEAKKSFAKALRANTRCETIYLASCFTTAVLEQIESDGQVRKVFNLIDVFDNEAERQRFLREIFHYIIRIG